jgi:bifunctional N-acetylglucosamine-1-phosphate-uridyltransferase/glucosamine-1-phosphate-acetyltransferase GlmU-like protein
VALFWQKGYRTDAYVCDDPDVVKAVNTPLELQECESIMRSKINRMHRKTAYVSLIAYRLYRPRRFHRGGTEIWPNTIITGETEIGADNLIIASRIDTCTMGTATYRHFTLEQSIIENKVQIGPYAISS